MWQGRTHTLFLVLILSLFLGLWTESAHAEFQNSQCGQSNSKSQRYNWCIYSSGQKAPSQDVIYYFHGIRRDERAWGELNFHAPIITEWQKQRGYAPYVISVSYGGEWTLTDTSLHGNRYTEFVNTVMKEMEQRLPAPPLKRYLIGESMGGYNASLLWLKNPELFEKVSIGCPAIAQIGPFSSSKEVNAYISRTGANAFYVQMVLDVGKNEFANEKEYSEFNSLLLAQNLKPPVKTPIYISCGDRDDFGFFEGAQLLYQAATKAGAVSEFAPVKNGGHCRTDIGKLAQFFLSP
ncbi:MAG: hypothetical protein COT73_10745 [Bdellovibrio sp. CG10_big_fil_rev_8_21_14_0_10_47_8]|nr:MAG: hypothetical protein COT73_10745 [Bdellovibrio sp. CG10_big_fil_rev_8_21_14_0_10_47_8]